MCDDLKNNKQLKLSDLNLYGKSLKDQGFNSICEALTTNKSIVSLCLGLSKPDIKGIQALSEALKINKSLTDLSLARTDLNNEKIKILSEGLKVNKGLIHLNLGEHGQTIDNEGVTHLLEVLKMNKTLEKIEIDSSHIDKDLMLKLEMALTENRNKK